MRHSFFVCILLLGLALVATPATSAQVIKIPNILTPKPQPAPTETPKPQTSSDSKARSLANAPTSGGPYAVKPVPPMEPQFLSETLDIGVAHWDYFWKLPNDNHNASWAPRIRFFVFYGGTTKLRFKAEYFGADGSPWFSETLEDRSGLDVGTGVKLVMSGSSLDLDKKAIVTGGLFGIKITNMRDNSTMFQGKFKVVRYKPQYSDPQYKNDVDYYVDYDWKLPIGIADLNWERDNATPTIRMWFKGDLKKDNFEARLFRNLQQIATTDDGGRVEQGEEHYADKRGDDKSLFWREFKFTWPYRAEFIVTEYLRRVAEFKNTLLINQMPGEYTVKVYFDGEQVRETKFSIGDNGNYADNGIAKQSGLTTNTVLLPVKVMGTLDKWNPANAKAMGFFGNPVDGIP